VKPLSEHQEQAVVVEWWDHYSKTRKIPTELLIAIPNAAKRSYKLAARLKAEGLRSGVPDLFLAWTKHFRCKRDGYMEMIFGGLWIEMKVARKGANPTKQQTIIIELLRYAGYNAIICRGATEAIRAIRAYCET
jgi:hypothetical protein